jgi:UPF0716 protein FxsA
MRWLGVAAVALLVLAAAEVALFVVVAKLVGLAWALALVLAGSVAGGWLLRREGARGWRRFRQALDAGRATGREATDGVLGLVGALLLVVPGFLTDVAGLLLLTPPVRALARGGVRRLAESRVPPTLAGDLFGPRRVRARRGTSTADPAPPPADAADASDGEVVEGEIVDPRP